MNAFGKSKSYELAKALKPAFPVIPVKTGIQESYVLLDSRLRGSDDLEDLWEKIEF